MPLAPRPEYDPRSLARSVRLLAQALVTFLSERPSHEVWLPATFEESGSDLHRSCLLRLCCTFRLSQPPGALFRLNPFQPCFMLVTLLGLHLQRVPLSGSRPDLSAAPALHAVVASGRTLTCANAAAGVRLQGFEHPVSPFVAGGVTRYPRAVPLVVLPLRGIDPVELGPVLPRCLLSWACS